MPRPKPPRISAADKGWPSSSTSATRTAVAPMDRVRNSRSMLMAAPALGAARVVVDMESPGELESRTEAELLFQIVPLGARGFDRTAYIARPLHHRAGIEPGIGAAEQFMHHKPVGRRPVTGVAIADHGTGRHMARDHGEFRLRLQAIGCGVVERGAVDVERARDVAIGQRSRRLFLAGEERYRARIDQRRVA